jgi:hypothetical protein
VKAAGVVVIVLIALALLFLLPRRVIAAPEWMGRPMPGISMQEVWQHYSLENDPGREIRTTDAAGRVVFPARLRLASRARRFAGCVQQVRRHAYEASCGPHSWVVIHYPSGYGQNNDQEFRQAELSFDGGRYSRSDTVVVHACRSETGFACSTTK